MSGLFDNEVKNDNIINIKSQKDRAIENLNKGNVIGTCLSIILESIDRFNSFNKSNDFHIKMGSPDIRFYKNENINPPLDMRYIIGLSKKGDDLKFTQFFFPYRSIYVILDHILGSEGIGEYNRDFSKIDIELLNWYFNFLNYYKESDEFFNYLVISDFRKLESFPINPLFKINNIVVAYIPLLFYDEVFSETIIRINFDAISKSIKKSNKEKNIEENEPIEKSKLFNINRIATDDELDNIIEKIIKQ